MCACQVMPSQVQASCSAADVFEQHVTCTFPAWYAAAAPVYVRIVCK
jgi:hypothetical protein